MGRRALIVVDMVNTYEHEDAEALTRSVEAVLPQLRDLLRRAKEEEALTIYVNDNFGAWKSDRDELVEHATSGPYGHLVKPIVPDPDSLFVVKARHSIFFQTPLEYLLGSYDVDEVVLTGQATEQCILYSALDAYIRHLQVVVVRDAVAHIHEHLADAALELMERNMRAEIRSAADCRL